MWKTSRTPSRAVALLGAAVLLFGCGRVPPAPKTVDLPAGVCQVGLDGGPVGGQVADKGIGGTGAPLVADRGIGGTGAPVLADKGIGGTGIIAVITGFASICLAGQEVALPPETPILLGADPGTASGLRAGQVAVVDAVDAGSGLSARRVAIRYEVSGPVEAVAPDQLRVAGQVVAVTPATLGLRPAVGDWVAVSGIRRTDGTIEATRLSPRQPGPAVVHGVLRRDGGQFHIGTLPLSPVPGLDALVGRSVAASGPVLLGRLEVETITLDLIASDPAAFFGPTVGTVLVEGFGAFGGDRLRLGQNLVVPARGTFATEPRRGVFRLERGANGLLATGGPGGGRDLAPAPVPLRDLSSPGGRSAGPQDGAGPPRPRGDARDGGGFGPGPSPGGRPGRGR